MNAIAEATNMRPSPHPQSGMPALVMLVLVLAAFVSLHLQLAMM